METIEFHLRGIVPTMMQADILANPLHPLKRDLQKITGKNNKSDADHEEIARIEFVASLYYDDEIGPYWPAQNIERMFFDAAKLSRQGQTIRRGFTIPQDKTALIYKGPRVPEKLYADLKFVDMRSVVVSRKRIMRCRPIFPEWEIKFAAIYDSEILNRETLEELANVAGQYIGLSAYRPRFGRFEVVV